MNAIDKESLQDALKSIDEKINRLNRQKITALFESLGLLERNDISKEYLNWENVLIVVPSRDIFNEIKKYKDLTSRLALVINTNADQIHIYDFALWDKSIRNKTKFQIRELLKSNFGGTEKIAEKRDWVKLLLK
ncbi:hypothetical protein NYQ10_20860 [Flavobacterium johnsoniae]|uniref:hypothetical protein n=1 Tax=Flavobacterium TaxID=237 RepID=UPI0015BFE906|nr:MULTISPECIES: hypothetical protein [Flavobacterium]NWL02823.1 hypothetical protein [Flavobacterium collinsii]WET04049.1 hypothetical protein P0R33_06830 [Flavobacterium sp. YJ01]WJS94536.1 hypothetical protein NYQ10_20860 [Flavobacterium johnsoniae]